MLDDILFLLSCIEAENIDQADDDIHYDRQHSADTDKRIDRGEDIDQRKYRHDHHDDILDDAFFIEHTGKDANDRKDRQGEGQNRTKDCITDRKSAAEGFCDRTADHHLQSVLRDKDRSAQDLLCFQNSGIQSLDAVFGIFIAVDLLDLIDQRGELFFLNAFFDGICPVIVDRVHIPDPAGLSRGFSIGRGGTAAEDSAALSGFCSLSAEI